ncbi:MAG: ABC transporter substrate-binding protein [Actinobacteria bacterium]|nr:ABC transporter substrate-binding protein [Actinomycetota bacterium]
MKKSRWLALLALLSAVMLLAAACGGDDDDGDAGAEDVDCNWVIGTMGALSGDNATIGQPIFQGIEYAVEELNEAGELPCTLELVDEDSQGDPAQAPPLAQSLVENEELVAIVGPYFSGETLATGEIFSESGVAFVCPSCTGATIDDQGYETFFRAVADDDVQGEVAGQYLTSLGGSVAIAHDNQDYSKGLADAVAKTVGDTEGPFIISPGEEDSIPPVVTQIVDAGTDLLFYGGYSAEAKPLVQQLREAGYEGTIVSDDGAKDSTFGEIGDAVEGLQVTCPCVDPLGIPEAEAFVSGINETYDRDPGTFAADAYDATNLVAEALKEADPEGAVEDVRVSVVEYLRDANYTGITKTYQFTETGNLDVGPEAVYVYEWSTPDEDFVSLGPASELIE